MNRHFASILENRNILLYLRHLCLAFVITFGLFSVIATGGGDNADDDNNDNNAQANFYTCEETIKVLLRDEQSTLLGISADDVLGQVGDGFTTTAFYSGDTSILTQSPLGGETHLTLAISYNGGEIREIESEPVNGNGDEIAPAIAVDCRHRLEIDVSVAVSTADGAFSENWQGVLVESVNSTHDGFDYPYLTADFDPSVIEGTFKIVSISGTAPDSVTGSLHTSAIDPYNGSIDILVQQTIGEGDDSTVSQSRHVALSWEENQ